MEALLIASGVVVFFIYSIIKIRKHLTNNFAKYSLYLLEGMFFCFLFILLMVFILFFLDFDAEDLDERCTLVFASASGWWCLFIRKIID